MSGLYLDYLFSPFLNILRYFDRETWTSLMQLFLFHLTVFMSDENHSLFDQFFLASSSLHRWTGSIYHRKNPDCVR